MLITGEYMARRHDKEGIWLSENSDRARLRDAENARKNRAEITAALSHGQVSRRELVKWGLFTAGGIMLPIGGLNPFVRPLSAQTVSTTPTTKLSRSAVLASDSNNSGI